MTLPSHRNLPYLEQNNGPVLGGKDKQADLLKAFLELAGKERKLGKRSLLEILSGETAEINARSDSAEADGARVSSELALLSAMGVLMPKHLVL